MKGTGCDVISRERTVEGDIVQLCSVPFQSTLETDAHICLSCFPPFPLRHHSLRQRTPFLRRLDRVYYGWVARGCAVNTSVPPPPPVPPSAPFSLVAFARAVRQIWDRRGGGGRGREQIGEFLPIPRPNALGTMGSSPW